MNLFSSSQAGADDSLGLSLVITVPLIADDKELAEKSSLLSSDELARATRYLSIEARRRFIVMRSSLRQLLGRLIDCSAGEVQFAYGPLGKPRLLDSSSKQIHFNLSHSRDLGLIAVNRTKPVGIDLEYAVERDDMAGIANQLFSSEERLLWKESTEDQKLEVLMRAWVAKEAILKCLGVGIADYLHRLEFSSLPNLTIDNEVEGRFIALRSDASSARESLASASLTVDTTVARARFIECDEKHLFAAISVHESSADFRCLTWQEFLEKS